MNAVTSLSTGKLSTKKILITGGSGFIGRNLARRLCEIGAEVHMTSRVGRDSDQTNLKWWIGSFDDFDTAKKILSEVRPDIICHLAGEVTASNDVELVRSTYHSLLTSTVNILSLAAEMGCERIILTGSTNEPLDKDPQPNSPYSAAKWATNVYGHLFEQLYKLPVVIVRPAVGYGPDQPKDKIIPFVIRSLLKGESPKLTNGLWVTDWIYIDDTVDGILSSAVLPGLQGHTIDLGSGVLTSVREVVEKIVDIMEPETRPIFGALPDRYVEHTRAADTKFAYSKLNWKTKVALEEGLRATVKWFKANSLANWFSLSFLDIETLEELFNFSFLSMG
jgi:nucleoside-diphosphate-sugar epimerase